MEVERQLVSMLSIFAKLTKLNVGVTVGAQFVRIFKSQSLREFHARSAERFPNVEMELTNYYRTCTQL